MSSRLRLVGGSAVDAEAVTPTPAFVANSGDPAVAGSAETGRARGSKPGPASQRARHAAPPSRRSPLEDLPDEALVAMAQTGQMTAHEALYRRHAGFALNLAARIAGSTQEAEDVTHDAFLRAFDGIAGLRNPKAFRSWLGSIVVHAMRSRLRRAAILRFLGIGRSDTFELDCIASPDASQHTRAELGQLYALLRTLAPADRIAWTLRFVEGHDLMATAELCRCSLATVKRRIRRAQNYIDAHFVELGEGRSESGAPDSSTPPPSDPGDSSP